MTITYITGGIRSGKSEFAEQLVTPYGGSILYVAFGVITDEEMKERIKKHQERRPSDWNVLEKPNELSGYHTVYQQHDCILVDCISTWIANKCMDLPVNELMEQKHRDEIINEVIEWLANVRELNQPIIVVSNEVGLGGVALSPLGRLFQDVLGKVNQLIARESTEAYAVFSGLSVRLK